MACVAHGGRASGAIGRRWRLGPLPSDPGPVPALTTQYRESDWAFACRLMAGRRLELAG